MARDCWVLEPGGLLSPLQLCAGAGSQPAGPFRCRGVHSSPEPLCFSPELTVRWPMIKQADVPHSSLVDEKNRHEPQLLRKSRTRLSSFGLLAMVRVAGPGINPGASPRRFVNNFSCLSRRVICRSCSESGDFRVPLSCV
jgi:hypothetical protein